MPAGGWGESPLQNASQKQESSQRVPTVDAVQPTYTPRRSYLTCKVCDSGQLDPRSVFRMSSPVVAIGFILLIPSVVGILYSAFLFLGINTAFLGVNAHLLGGSHSRSTVSSHLFQSSYDANFRRSCAGAVRQKYAEAGAYVTEQRIEQYCECALSTVKQTGSEVEAAQTCLQRAQDGTLDRLGRGVDMFYASDSPIETSSVEASPTAVAGANTPVAFLRSGFAVALGIGSFVGGLLGWLLVMKKRVLQCDVCGAVVNAS